MIIAEQFLSIQCTQNELLATLKQLATNKTNVDFLWTEQFDVLGSRSFSIMFIKQNVCFPGIFVSKFLKKI